MAPDRDESGPVIGGAGLEGFAIIACCASRKRREHEAAAVEVARAIQADIERGPPACALTAVRAGACDVTIYHSLHR
jgi:hypothetical protein